MPKVLIVEDNEMNRDMLSRRLERRGFVVVIAIDGAQGVAMSKTELPDIVLMDMSLPVMNGWEATRAIKADPTRMKTRRSARAPKIPQNRTRCCSLRGIAMAENSSAHTKTLSTLNDFSIR